MPPVTLPPLPDSPVLSVHPDRRLMGEAAAEHVIQLLLEILRDQQQARVVFACAPSQNEFLEALVRGSRNRVDWQRITAFHMDEYVGLEATHPASFRSYLHAHLLAHVQPGAFHAIAGEAADPGIECARYAALLEAAPIDLICLGIGENGHLAFNDPPVADFNDPVSAKVVELDLACREQQVHDGCFPRLEDVPRHAITLTLPVFERAKQLSVVVPGERKATAVREACKGEVSTNCPASLLRTRRKVTLFLDHASAAKLS